MLVVLAHDLGEDVVAAGGDHEVVDLAHGGHLVGDGLDVALDADPDHRGAVEAHLHRVGDRDDLHDPRLDEPLHPLTHGRLGEADRLADGRVGPTAVLLQLLDDRLADVVEDDADGSIAGNHGVHPGGCFPPKASESVDFEPLICGFHCERGVRVSETELRR